MNFETGHHFIGPSELSDSERNRVNQYEYQMQLAQIRRADAQSEVAIQRENARIHDYNEDLESYTGIYRPNIQSTGGYRSKLKFYPGTNNKEKYHTDKHLQYIQQMKEKEDFETQNYEEWMEE